MPAGNNEFALGLKEVYACGCRCMYDKVDRVYICMCIMYVCECVCVSEGVYIDPACV